MKKTDPVLWMDHHNWDLLRLINNNPVYPVFTYPSTFLINLNGYVNWLTGLTKQIWKEFYLPVVLT